MKKLLILLLFCCCVSSFAAMYDYNSLPDFGHGILSENDTYVKVVTGVSICSTYTRIHWRRYVVLSNGGFRWWTGSDDPGFYSGSFKVYTDGTSTDSLWDSYDKSKIIIFGGSTPVDSDGDGYNDDIEILEGSNWDDSSSLPDMTIIYDSKGNKLGLRSNSSGAIGWDSGTVYNDFYFVKDENDKLVPAGVADGQTAINLDTDDVTDVKFHYNSSGDIVGADYSKDNVDHIDFPGYWGSFYDSSGNYTGSISNTGSITPSAGSSSGGHASTIGDNLGGNQISNPEFPDTGSTFDDSPLTLPNEPTVNQDNTDLATVINSQSQNIIDVGNNLDSRLQKNNYDRSQQARVINNSLSALREEQITVAQAHLSQDLTLHNDRTQQLNMIDNSIAGLRDDLTQSNNNINSNLSAIKEKLTLESTQKKELSLNQDILNQDKINRQMIHDKFTAPLDALRNKLQAGEAPVIEFDLTPLDPLLFGWDSLGVHRLDFNDPNLVLIRNIVRNALLVFCSVFLAYAQWKIIFQFSHNG